MHFKNALISGLDVAIKIAYTESQKEQCLLKSEKGCRLRDMDSAELIVCSLEFGSSSCVHGSLIFLMVKMRRPMRMIICA